MKISFIADTVNFTVATSLECLSCLGNILFILLLYFIILYYILYILFYYIIILYFIYFTNEPYSTIYHSWN